jgi:hypothetical protein
MESRYDYDIIRDYLHGLVEREKALEIGELIRQDEIARDIAEGILRLDDEFNENEQDIEAYLENFRQAQLKKISYHSSGIAAQTRNLWLKIAAVILILVVTGFFIKQAFDKPDLITLINEELSQPYPVSNVVRGPSHGDDYNKALEMYKNKNYVQASLYFEKAAKSENDHATVTFYNALSSLYSGHYPRAISLLESRTISASRYSQQAQWYLSLAYIKSEKQTKGVEILKRMQNSPHVYKHREAVQLLEALD